jgi:hypothetical protein
VEWSSTARESTFRVRSESRPSPNALEGDTVQARAAYKDFLTLWKDADPDIPVLQQAKAEYSKLQ